MPNDPETIKEQRRKIRYLSAVVADLKHDLKCCEEQVPFSLSCVSCGAGDGVTSSYQAHQDGWFEIGFDPGGPSWNWLGTCPECQKEEEADGAPEGPPENES